MFRLWQFYKDYKQDKEELEELRKEVELLGSVLEEKKQETREECSKDAGFVCKPEIIHTRAIIGGKMYDTEKAEKIGEIPSYIIDKTVRNKFMLFKTENGRHFVCEVNHTGSYVKPDGIMQRTIEYYGIRAVNFIEIKEIIGQAFPDLYIELFGEAEEA